MKAFLIEKMINLVKKNQHYDVIDLEKIQYGLEGFYLTLTKFLIILIISSILGIIKEFIIFTILYNIIRMPAFGIHASKSYICLIFSSIIFLLVPYLAKVTTQNIYINLVLGLFSLLMIILYAPADTYKRPLISKVKRHRFKAISLFIGIIYFVLSLITKSAFMSNVLIFSLFIESILIIPITYKIFKMPYQNYKTYQKHVAV